MNHTINMYILTFTNVALLAYISVSWVPYRGFEEHMPRHAYRDRDLVCMYYNYLFLDYGMISNKSGQATIWTTTRYPC